MSYRCKSAATSTKATNCRRLHLPALPQGVEVFEKVEEKPAATGEKTLAGTKTEKNLQAAFASESQARNKYTYSPKSPSVKATSSSPKSS